MSKQRTISQKEYLSALGIFELVRKYRVHILELEESLANILHEPTSDGFDSYYGHVSDSIWENYDLNTLLKKMEIKVKK